MANTAVIEKWVEALESDEYEQVTGRLKRNTNSGVVGYCCLGVLCELAVKEKVIAPGQSYRLGEWGVTGERATELIYHFDGAEMSLPSHVANWAEVGTTDPVLYEKTDEGRVGHRASIWNDDYGYDFHQIAQLIRNTYLENE